MSQPQWSGSPSTWSSDPVPLLLQQAFRQTEALGRIEASVEGLRHSHQEVKAAIADHGRRITALETAKPKSDRSELIKITVMILVVALAAAGKISWGDALPSLTGLVR